MWNENSTEILLSYTEPLVLEAYLTPHSTFHIPQKVEQSETLYQMKKGDKVRFLSESGGGIVAGFQGKDIVLVEDEDGFQIPTRINDVVVIDTDASAPTPSAPERPSQKVETPVLRPVIEERKGGDKLSVYLAFVPIDIHAITSTRFETYIVNDSNYYIYYSYLVAEGNSWTLRAMGEVEPNTKEFIEEFGKEDLNDLSQVSVQFIAYKRDKSFMLKEPIQVKLRIDGVKFYKLHTFQENDFFEQKALLYTVVENDKVNRPLMINADELKKEMYHKEPADKTRVDNSYVRRYDNGKSQHPFLSKHTKGDEPVVVDLHAHEILETTSGMSASDILSYQLDIVHRTLAEHKDHKGKKIVFIHGKGEGVLRRAIIHELNYRYKSYTYQDASFQEYGYGATQVTIK